ncbi:DUF3703 domain-containing protein [Niveispirillum cyanobacteriorum]|uniref:Uncharacterized protein n=1 Tax=Niveispirillum cyanobacteriorum TaxID=1612173 RepID=A0A2K9N7E6_9PROT|nr:DUF3703 domain-containing protein [Niveispirillum cyanobacteriorum]AUN28902.1 hypothetical protein C0V82_00505 [Niveispirillum cyanobacteriorum]GGE69362.1 hypothetical protein GCM10011317_28250 [Niveispirillum cyanobacteriorum]
MPDRRALVEDELVFYRQARAGGDIAAAWAALERAHILGQMDWWQHARVHLLMLGLGLAIGDLREIGGQLFRLVLAVPGSVTGKAPPGNSGRSNISAFLPQPIAPDLAAKLNGHPSP